MDIPLPDPPDLIDLSVGDLSRGNRKRAPWLGVTALLMSVASVVGLFVGNDVIRRHTPTVPLEVIVDDIKEIAKQAAADAAENLVEASKEQMQDAGSKLRAWSGKLTGTGGVAQEAAEGEPSSIGDAEVTLGTTKTTTVVRGPARPGWVDLLDRWLLGLVVGGTMASVLLAGVSQIRGEPVVWGLLAQFVGVMTLNFLLLALWLAVIVGVVLLLVLKACLAGSISDVDIDLPDIDLPGV